MANLVLDGMLERCGFCRRSTFKGRGRTIRIAVWRGEGRKKEQGFARGSLAMCSSILFSFEKKTPEAGVREIGRAYFNIVRHREPRGAGGLGHSRRGRHGFARP